MDPHLRLTALPLLTGLTKLSIARPGNEFPDVLEHMPQLQNLSIAHSHFCIRQLEQLTVLTKLHNLYVHGVEEPFFAPGFFIRNTAPAGAPPNVWQQMQGKLHAAACAIEFGHAAEVDTDDDYGSNEPPWSE